MKAINKSLDFSDKDFEGLIAKHGMTLTGFEKWIEKDLLINKLIAKGTKEKGLTRDALLTELYNRAKVEILSK